ncbi:uncharacterized protein LOC112046934 [Bicyclus anynana]|uniref:Uncharacterized protein LOC112046934 n=1 Tax=Bicyclus anynana TaxID=110368 RepID=A0A6J1N3J1_BICAN|nr:uncharacterized protein LOC112046934 [Bicyclus anynana]
MKNITNMGSLRVCVLLLVTLVQFQRIAGKPLFGELFGDYLCDYLCDDDDDVSTTTSTSREDADWDVFGMCTCGTRRPPGTRRRGQGIPANINMRLPPSANGMNFSMTNTNGAWSFQLDANPNNPIGGPVGSFPGGAGVIPIGGPTTFTPIVGGASTVVATTATTAKP